MKYLVMETHPAYAVLLDEEGRFLKAANLGYQVGDRVEEVVELNVHKPKDYPWAKAVTGLCAAAACCCLAFFGYYQPNYTPYGTLRIQINPDVELTLSRTERVLALEGRNQAGARLVEDYDYQGKTLEETAMDLMERAVEMGYLESGDTVSIAVESGDGAWKTREETETLQTLQEAYGDWACIRLSRDDLPEPSPSAPAVTAAPTPVPTPAASAPAATPGPVSTPVLTPPPAPKPTQNATPKPTPTPTPTPTPVPTAVPEDDDDDDWDDDLDDSGDDDGDDDTDD